MMCPATDLPHLFVPILGEEDVGIPRGIRCEDCGADAPWDPPPRLRTKSKKYKIQFDNFRSEEW